MNWSRSRIYALPLAGIMAIGAVFTGVAVATAPSHPVVTAYVIPSAPIHPDQLYISREIHAVQLAAARAHAAHKSHVAHVALLKAEADARAAAHAAYLASLKRPAPRVVAPVAPSVPVPTHTYTPPPPPVNYGYYSCTALENLWTSEGGNPGSAFIAAQIATAESGGNPGAISPTSDYGLWQINSSNAPGGEMLNPVANVREAISLSGNGSNWGPWTTYTSGIYASEC